MYIYIYLLYNTHGHTHILLKCTLFINPTGVNILIFEEEEGIIFQDSTVLKL